MSRRERAGQLPGMPGVAQGWIDSYALRGGAGDVLRSDYGRGARWWHRLFDEIAMLGDGSLADVQARVSRQVAEIGTAFRLPGDDGERRWPLSALPLLIGADEWRGIADGVAQRARLLEAVLDDVFGAQTLMKSGALPPALIAGSRHYWRSMVGVEPPGGRRMHIYAADLARGHDGEWRVVGDHTRAPIGAGYALENRLAASRVMGAAQTRLNVHRLAPFFSAFRGGLAAACARSDPRIALLTPGRFNASYPEQAHLARYLGMLLVEGEDLAVRGDTLYVRTIEGLKRIDAVWRRMDTRFLDPLAFDSGSAIGVPGLIDAYAAGTALIANAPGAGVAEAPALAALLPKLARRLIGESLTLSGVQTWWCGDPGACDYVEAVMDRLVIAPAHGSSAAAPAGLPGGRAVLGATLNGDARAMLLEDLGRRPQDYVGQEVTRLSTMPAIMDGALAARPFTLRVFAARDADGGWTVMPGGFARLGHDLDAGAALMGEGTLSADVCVLGLEHVAHVSLLPADVPIRRNPGTLPSRAADNLFWLGRYLERGEATLRIVRAALGATIDADAGAGLERGTLQRLMALLAASGAAPEGENVATTARAALFGSGIASVATLSGIVRQIGEGIRDRLSADVWRLIEQGFGGGGGAGPADLLDRATALQERFSALAGLSAENMGRTAGWRFHDMGRRIERALTMCRQLRAFGGEDASADDLTTLLDLGDCQISYRARYMTGLALAPVRDLVALDPFNPRAIAFAVARIGEHLAALPPLHDDGMTEEPVRIATEVAATLATARAAALDAPAMIAVENRLLALSEAIGQRFFLQGGETLRASGMVLA